MSSLRPNTIKIVPKSPFANCKLDRQQFADVLTKVIELYPEGFVLSIDNPWGGGKTTFVRMWEQQLKDLEYKTVYFNAWENDYIDNPLVAITAEIKSILEKDNEQIIDSLLVKGSKILSASVPALIKGIATKYGLDEAIGEALKNTAEESTELLKEEVDSYETRKKYVADFRKELENFSSQISTGKPIIIFIDELDRCRPNYSVEVLECIKHIFSVQGLTFVLSIDKTQLGEAVKGVYGSQNLDANEYLRRFIDLEYSLPKPYALRYWDYLYESSSLNDFFEGPLREPYPKLRYDKNSFLIGGAYFVELGNLSLRQMDSMFIRFTVVLRSFGYDSYVFPSTILFLLYLLEYHSSLLNKIQTLDINIYSLVNQISSILTRPKEERQVVIWRSTIGTIIYLYSHDFNDSKQGGSNQDTNYLSSLNQNFDEDDSVAISLILDALESDIKTRSLKLNDLIRNVLLTAKIVS